MKIKLTRIYVNDQDKALRFYTEVMGFVKKADVTQGDYRWLAVATDEEPDGVQMELALNSDPAAEAFHEALYKQRQPAAMFHTSDLQADYERMKAAGAHFIEAPSSHQWGSMAVLDDTCGNLIQLTQPAW